MTNKYYIKFERKRLADIPKKKIAVIVLIGLFTLYCVVNLFLPYDFPINNLTEYSIHIDKVYVWDSHDAKGARMKLEILDGSRTFYLWYPQTEYLTYSRNVERDLLSGKITNVSAKVAAYPDIRDCVGKQLRIVDLRAESTVYYSLDTEIKRLRQNRISCWVLFVILFVIFHFYLCYILLSYKAVEIKER